MNLYECGGNCTYTQCFAAFSIKRYNGLVWRSHKDVRVNRRAIVVVATLLFAKNRRGFGWLVVICLSCELKSNMYTIHTRVRHSKGWIMMKWRSACMPVIGRSICLATGNWWRHGMSGRVLNHVWPCLKNKIRNINSNYSLLYCGWRDNTPATHTYTNPHTNPAWVFVRQSRNEK